MNNLLSDYNSNNVTASNVARTNLYTDLDLSFNIHPILKDIVPVSDLDAVKNSIKNLVLTSFYERPFHPEIGSTIGGLLFEPVNLFTGLAIKNEIERVIQKFEPRVNDVTVQVIDESDNNAYLITVGFNVLYDTKSEIQFYLNRLR
jgi:phage baseplate assembly protein W